MLINFHRDKRQGYAVILSSVLLPERFASKWIDNLGTFAFGAA
ncbi:protein of unknown function [Shewanella benthica]|uniref:Uncharacterized protein n=1 Tax=Shewanella benthica TaxID=43661 RepID=A0A330M017_9GAMM|nr:protein of unknown function [Shewanella benthica]